MRNFKQFKYLSEEKEEKKKLQKELEKEKDDVEEEQEEVQDVEKEIEKEETEGPSRADGSDKGDKLEQEKAKFDSDLAHDDENLDYDKNQAKADGLRWLQARYGEEIYVFQHIPGLDMESEDIKSYSISVNGSAYTINIRRFEDLQDGSSSQGEKGIIKDLVGYDILPGAVAPVPMEAPDEKSDEKPEL